MAEQLKTLLKREIDKFDNELATKENEARIKELELELAKTKLALVETECKNQDLTHQLSVIQPFDNQSNVPGGAENDRRPSLTRGGNKWLSRTLSSIRETAASATASHSSGTTIPPPSNNLVRSATLAPEKTLATSASSTQMQKSSSVQGLKTDE